MRGATKARMPISMPPSKARESSLSWNRMRRETRRDLLGGSLAAVRLRAERPPTRSRRLPRRVQSDTRLAVHHRRPAFDLGNPSEAGSDGGAHASGLGRSDEGECRLVSSGDDAGPEQADGGDRFCFLLAPAADFHGTQGRDGSRNSPLIPVVRENCSRTSPQSRGQRVAAARCARKRFWHSIAIFRISANSGVERMRANIGSRSIAG